jgi:hypothetical protein
MGEDSTAADLTGDLDSGIAAATGVADSTAAAGSTAVAGTTAVAGSTVAADSTVVAAGSTVAAADMAADTANQFRLIFDNRTAGSRRCQPFCSSSTLHDDPGYANHPFGAKRWPQLRKHGKGADVERVFSDDAKHENGGELLIRKIGFGAAGTASNRPLLTGRRAHHLDAAAA